MITQRGVVGKNGIFKDAAFIRSTVFSKEQHFCPLIEFDNTDKTAYHTVLYLDGKPIGTGRAFKNPKTPSEFHLGRIAILKPYRGMKLGNQIMNYLEKYSISQGATKLVLSAQVRVKKFYLGLGYIPVGNEYLDEWCPHIEMMKKI